MKESFSKEANKYLYRHSVTLPRDVERCNERDLFTHAYLLIHGLRRHFKEVDIDRIEFCGEGSQLRIGYLEDNDSI